MQTMLRRLLASVTLGLAAAPLAAQDKPLSAIDWLSQSVDARRRVCGRLARRPDEPPVADDAATPDITVTPLDRPSPDGIGLLESASDGPAASGGQRHRTTLITLIQAERVETLPCHAGSDRHAHAGRGRSTAWRRPRTARCFWRASTNCLTLARWNPRRPCWKRPTSNNPRSFGAGLTSRFSPGPRTRPAPWSATASDAHLDLSGAHLLSGPQRRLARRRAHAQHSPRAG